MFHIVYICFLKCFYVTLHYEKLDIINNVFFNQQDIEDCKRIFCKIQRVYFAFSRLARIVKFKYAKVVVDEHMCLNTIDRNHKNRCALLNRPIHYFYISQLYL